MHIPEDEIHLLLVEDDRLYRPWYFIADDRIALPTKIQDQITGMSDAVADKAFFTQDLNWFKSLL